MGLQVFFLPIQNENTWDFIPCKLPIYVQQDRRKIYLWALKRVWLWLAIITHGQTPERQTLTKFKEIYWQRRTEL